MVRSLSKSGRKGLTLIEMLVVIAVMAVILALIFPQISTVYFRDRAGRTMVRAVQAANDAYEADYGFVVPGEITLTHPYVDMGYLPKSYVYRTGDDWRFFVDDEESSRATGYGKVVGRTWTYNSDTDEMTGP